jgi:uncharacterized protein YfaS (alpha-2-macroglobulin family)
MTARRLLSIFTVFVVWLLVCSLGAPLLAQESDDENDLKVLNVFPAGPVPLIKQFTVTFNQPMVPLGAMERDADQVPMQISPPMKGQYRWLNVYTLAFEPETPLEGSSKGEVVIPAGTKAMSGATLKQEYRAAYALPMIFAESTRPRENSGGLELKPNIRVRFNQPVDVGHLSTLTYFITEKGQKIPAEAEEDKDVNKYRHAGGKFTCSIKPVRDLPPDTGFDLVIPPGLKSTSGPIPSEKLQRFPFRTYGPLRIKEVVGYRPGKNKPYDPESGITVKFTNPVPMKEVLKHLKISPQYDMGRLSEDEGYESEVTDLWIYGPFKPETVYTFTVSKNIKDVFGQTLQGRTQWQVPLGPARPFLDLPGRQGVLEVVSDPTYPFQARNIKNVQARGVFITPDEAIPFLSGHGLHEYLYESRDDTLSDIAPDRIKYMQIPVKLPSNIAAYQPVHLKKLFGSDPGPGIMYFDLNAKETNYQKTDAPIYRRAVVQISNIGLSAKFGLANTLIWTTNLATAEPLTGVRLEIRDKKNKVLWRGISGENGLVNAPGAETFKIKDDNTYGEPSLYVMAYHENQFSMVSDQWNQGISPWSFGLEARMLDEGQEYMTWVLTGLPLYKPGDHVDFKLIQRKETAGGLVVPGTKDIKVTVENSRGEEIQTFDLKLNQFGTAWAAFDLDRKTSLGHYSIYVESEDRGRRYAGSFRVETYRKPTFGIDLTPSVKEGFSGDKINVGLKATYHFGAPVRKQPGRYVVTASQTGFTIPRFEDYTVEDWMSDPEQPDEPVPVVAEGNLVLNDKGEYEFSFQATPPVKPVIRSFQVETTVTDVDQRTVSDRTSVLIHPASYYIGMKTDAYLVGPGEKIHTKIIAAAPDGKLLPNITTDVTLYRRVWQTVRRKGVGGYYHYVSNIVDEKVSTHTVTTGDQPVELTFEVDKSGYYFAAARSKDEAGRTAASAVDFYAYGSGPAGWEHYDHDRIDLIPDKKEYRAGETATIMVKSPFTSGTGLLTIERSGVLRQETFKIESSSPNLEIKLEPGDSPNVYVSVVLVRGRISEEFDKQGKDAGKPAIKAGYVELTVKDDSRKLNVEVAPDRPEARPGEDITLTVKVKDNQGTPQEAEVALIVADEALLQLASENVYYPERLFFSTRPLGVWTADLRLNLIGRRHYGLKGAKPGGGGVGAGETQFRKKFVSLALWKPSVITDKNGTATLKFKLPDNLTKFKIFAVANTTKDMFGTGTNNFTVTQPLLIKPGLPNFAGIGDEFMASVVLHNRSKNNGQARVVLSGDQFEITGPSEKEVEVAAESSQEVMFPVRALPGDKAKFRFIVQMGEEKDAAEYAIPLRYPNSLRTVATYGRLTKSSKKSVKLPEGSDRDRGALSITVSPSLAGNMEGAFDFLHNYPHACLEQKTSKALGDMVFLVWRDRLGGDKAEIDKAKARLNTYIDEIGTFQKYNGGLWYWPGSQYDDPYLTGYVIQVMTYLKQAGFKVDQNVYTRAVNYAKNTINKNRWPSYYSERFRFITSVYLTAVLAEAGQPVEAMVENLYLRRNEMEPFELSLMLMTIGRYERNEYTQEQITDLNNRLFARAVITSGEVHFEQPTGYSGLLASTARTNAFILRALLTATPESPHITPLARWLVNERKNGHWGNTQSNALVLLSMAEYLRVMEADPPNFKLSALLAGRHVLKASFDAFDQPAQSVIVPNAELSPDEKMSLDLKYEGTGAAYYLLRLKYAPEKPDLEAFQAGFSLSRTYTRMDPNPTDKPSDTFSRGDVVKIDVVLVVPSQRHWVVLEDHLPAGLEPINFGLPTAPAYLTKMLNQGSTPQEYYQRYWYDHREIWQQRVAIYARQLREGVYTFSYLARAVTPGKFVAPGPAVEEMYSPETSGKGSGLWLEIK